jgi:hypothetical protein
MERPWGSSNSLLAMVFFFISSYHEASEKNILLIPAEIKALQGTNKQQQCYSRSFNTAPGNAFNKGVVFPSMDNNYLR